MPDVFNCGTLQQQLGYVAGVVCPHPPTMSNTFLPDKLDHWLPAGQFQFTEGQGLLAVSVTVSHQVNVAAPVG